MKNNTQKSLCDIHKTEDHNKYEKCVLCGAVTKVSKTTPIDQRPDYRPGAGQLCRECAIRNVVEEQNAMRRGFVYSLPVYQRDEA